MATTAQRDHLHALAYSLEPYRAQLDYPPGDQRTNRDNQTWAMSEQTALHVLHAGGRLQWDCSEFCSWLLKCAGLWKWDAPGYTGSHLDTIWPHYTDGRQALVGALVVFGPGAGHHEAMVMTPDPKHGDPLCVSHGQPGLQFATVSQLAAVQPPGITYLSIQDL
jgi:hypothetical protein